MTKRIEQMSPGEISILSKKPKETLFQESIVLAVRMSICDRNTTPANLLLKLLPLITKKPGAKEALIKWFETWGNLSFFTSDGKLHFYENPSAHSWANEYEAQVKASPWTEVMPGKTNTVVDADKEFRKVFDRLKKISEDPTKTILHAPLLSKVKEVLNTYGRTDEWAREEQRGRTLFDQSVKMTTTQASKFAKDT